MSPSGPRVVMCSITLEEHYANPAFVQGPGRDLAHSVELAEHLSTLDDGRIAVVSARRRRETSLTTGRPPRVASGGQFSNTLLG